MNSSSDPVVIVSAARTPMGSFQGCFSNLSASELGSAAISAALERTGLASDRIEEVIMGNVLMAGQGQAPARQSALGGGLALSTNCTTINKMCGSGMKAVMLAHDLLIAKTSRIMIAGGMESMTNAPYLLPKARSGHRMGHGQVVDSMFHDGLEDAYQRGQLMGSFAELCADKYAFTREQQDEFAIRSLKRARAASDSGDFDREIAPVTVRTRNDEIAISKDEQPFSANIEKIPHLKPAFRKGGTVTPANSSSISDGAAALVLMLESTAVAENLAPLARIAGHATHAHEPSWFTTAPSESIRKVLKQTGLTVQDVDLHEVNEAFAVVTMSAMRDLDISPDRMNVRGGACALGHPIGASGARILTTLISAMHDRSSKTGVASLCIGGGEATAMVLERY
ncbi:MAG: acetyl-CoA C-acyltransferase [Gammaproteobacteria bacterium]|nr:acetyl-CoA C-acyltransferase [Gammaproteobacteria bacterium]MCY4227711.1 acetyl-CoA C-acyltransferase [Gammaproteobacteria bacterium]